MIGNSIHTPSQPRSQSDVPQQSRLSDDTQPSCAKLVDPSSARSVIVHRPWQTGVSTDKSLVVFGKTAEKALAKGILVGTGKARSEMALSASTWGKKGLKVLAALVLAVPAAVVWLVVRSVTKPVGLYSEKVLEPKAARRYELANGKWIRLLRQPKPDSVVTLPGVMDALAVHAKRMGCSLGPTEIMGLVSMGEHLVNALAEGGEQGMVGREVLGSDGRTSQKIQEASVVIDGHTIRSSLYTTRAIAWYAMALAAKSDVQYGIATQHGQEPREMSHMVESGSFKVQDPDHRLFDFLRHQPTVSGRTSTHFNDEVVDRQGHYFNWFRTRHYGIDDPSKTLPGMGGALVFNKLRPSTSQSDIPELYLKFETSGCPDLGLRESHHTTFDKFMKSIASADRFLAHASSYVLSRFEKSKSVNGGAAVVRQEHVYKGILKSIVLRPFEEALRDAARDTKTISIDIPRLRKGVQSAGLPFVQAAIAAISHQDPSVAHHFENLLPVLRKLETQMALDGSPMAHRGAEAHLDMFGIWPANESALSANDFRRPPADLDRPSLSDVLADPASRSDSDLGSAASSESDSELRDASDPGRRERSRFEPDVSRRLERRATF